MNKIFHLLLVLLTTAAFIACPPPEEGGGANEVKPSGISVSANSTVVPINGTLLVSAAVEPATVDQSVTWTSSDSEIATVDAYGWVTGVKTGAVTITAASVVDPSVTGSITLTCESTAFETVWEFDGTDFILRLKGIKTYINDLETEEEKPATLTGFYAVGSGSPQQFGGTGISDDYAIRFPKDTQNASVSFSFKTEDGTDVTETFTKDFPDLSSIRFMTGKSATVTPAHVNILRKTDVKGEPEAKALVAFSLPDMEVLMNETWFEDGTFGSYDFTKAAWSGTVDAGGTEVAVPVGTPYADIYEFDLATGDDKECSVKSAEILIPGKSPDFVGLLTVSWGPDSLFGDKITVKGRREYPAGIWLDDQGNCSETAVEGYTKYVLSWGDDFNYPFNGLNYKNNAAYLAARETPGDPAYDFARLWGCENLEQGSHARKDGVWDFRTIEAKNGMLMSKHMAADVDQDIFYLGAGKTKPLGGFTDIATGAVKGFISGAAITNELYGKGYYVGKLRTRYKGYAESDPWQNPGAWFAFWFHGPVHEFDLMEQTVGEANIINYVNQYHNGWGIYGKPQGVTSTFHTKLKVTAGEEAVQNNWYTLALQWTADQVTYYYNNIWAHYYKSDSENKIATFTKNSNLSSAGFTLEGGNTGDTFNASERATQCTDWGYNGHLKAVPTCPVNVFLSTEIGGGWGGGSGSLPEKLETLPVWVEADYIAYYVPEGSAEAAN